MFSPCYCVTDRCTDGQADRQTREEKKGQKWPSRKALHFTYARKLEIAIK